MGEGIDRTGEGGPVGTCRICKRVRRNAKARDFSPVFAFFAYLTDIVEKQVVVVKRLIDGLFRGVEILIAIFLAIMIVLVFMNVVLRYLFSTGFVWSEEITRLCFIFLVYLGAIIAARENRHLLIDTLLYKVPQTAKIVIYTLIQICIVWLMVTLVRGSWGLVLQSFQDKWVTTKFPSWIVWASGIVTGISIAIVSAVNLYQLLVKKVPVLTLIQPYDGGDEPATVE
ncbi:MAG: TRAP transporter small permease [Treponema sp.]|nr:TRAP transporter small permease [Treponema sp.]